ncbi:Tetratricopeptide repeat-containing protein [Roseovarius litoreus]|uniref:Tetratricopeptide repeat-containing protein n=1 Tax=Roseovarius litoreus TaxID=1155722 RepID=A0A1M7KE70_9RHOB|nr:Tetratricopeptide repeat-containing protein [Roseovarius litoreus]
MSVRGDQGRGCFIGLRKDQLGARLLMMLNAIRLAEDYDTDFRINWFPRGAMAPKLDTPTDLFTPAFIDRHFMDNDTFEALTPAPTPIWVFLKDDRPDRLQAHLASGGHVVLDEGFEIVEFAWEDGEDLRGRFRGFISRIGFNPVVEGHIAEIEKAMSRNGGRTIAYHIRRGDILNEDPWKHKEWPAKIEPDELYSAHLEKNKGAGALVFSDQPESIARFTKAHPQVGSIEDLVDLSGCKPVQRDFLELFAMSRASEIVAPPISAFSRAAARLSGQERKCFHEVMTVAERDLAYERVYDRFVKGPGEFITPSEAAHVFVKLARRLQEAGREQEAWTIGQAILDAGADNAFMPLFHAINGMYLSKWDEALRYIDIALSDPHQWQENYITGLAVRAHVLGALGRRKGARQSFLQAFWQKPMLPDITVIGTFMIKRGRLRPGATLPFDRDTLLVLPVRYLQTNIVVQQSRILRRRASDLSSIAIEWPWFAMDGKTDRLLNAPRELERMRDRLAAHHGGTPGAGPYSYCALLEARMGRLKEALEMNTKAVEAAPEDAMVRKRQAEILLMTGDHAAALSEAEICRAIAPDHAFWHFLTGLIHRAAGDAAQARTWFEAACAMDASTAELHAQLADLCREMGDEEGAVAALDRAAEIAPNQQRYRNRRERLLKKQA